jgi:CRP-like cAMP-binding protein
VADEVRERLGVDPAVFAPSTESAIEDCEEMLLQSLPGPGKNLPVEVPLEEFELVAGLDPQELRILSNFLVKESFAAGATIIKEGDIADSLYFVVGGSVDVGVAGDRREAETHLACVDAGNVVGEPALLSNRRRTADVIAMTTVSARVLTAVDVALIARSHPRIHAKLIAALGESLSERLRRANAVIASPMR